MNPVQSKTYVYSPSQEPTGCFWKIKKGDKIVGDLLGSIHSTPTDFLNSRSRKCFNKSTLLAVEIDVTKEEKDLATFITGYKFAVEQYAIHYSKLSREQRIRLFKILQKLFPEDAAKIDFDKKYSAVEFIVKGIMNLKSQVNNEIGLSSGMDILLINQAKTLNKPVADLETLEQYKQQKDKEKTLKDDNSNGGFFFQYLSSEQLEELAAQFDAKMLFEHLSASYFDCFKPMYESYKKGDLDAFDVTTGPNYNNFRMKQRNKNMAKKIVELVNNGERIFVCVGAGHTVGKKNIREFLNKFGLSTERVFIKN